MTTAARSRPLACLAGLLAGGLAVAVGELVAGLVGGARSLIVSVGDQVIDLVPGPVKDVAIALFGTNDKLALLIGIGTALAVFAGVVGGLALRRPLLGDLGVGLLGLVGLLAALVQTFEGGVLAAVLPAALGSAVGVLALRLLLRPLRTDVSPAAGGPEASGARTDRRGFLRSAGIVGVAALAAGSVGRLLQSSASAVASRASLALGAPERTLPPVEQVAATGSVDVAGMTPFFTPNADFYRIDTALQVPQVGVETYRLRITGLVDSEVVLTFDELVALGTVEADITLTCVSNEVGGDLIGNARWQGIPLPRVLELAGVRPEADQLVGRSVDGYTCGFPVQAALDGRDALVAIGMNGEPLPLEHGFPVRLVVPGLYGYVSATKWLTELELTTFDELDHYWVDRGWAVRAPIKTQSRIDVPGPLARVGVGEVAVAGVAWAQTRGIAKVEVSVDDGPWEAAELAGEVNDVTWRQWVYRWDASETGTHSLRCRATDETGETQPEQRVPPIPDGATGWPSQVVMVTDQA